MTVECMRIWDNLLLNKEYKYIVSKQLEGFLWVE